MRRLSLPLLSILALCSACETEYEGKTLQQWMVSLNDDNPNTRCEAVYAVGQIGKKSQAAVAALAKALEDKHENVRLEAAEQLRQIGPEAKHAVPALLRALADSDIFVQWKAKDALEQVGQDAVPDLAQAMENENSSVRCAVAEVLGQMGPKAEKAVPALTKALGDPNEAVGREACQALKVIGMPPSLVSRIAATLNDADANIRLRAARALGRIGPDARHAVADLAQLVSDDSREVQLSTISALENIGAAEAVPVLIGALSSESPDVREAAAVTLGSLREAKLSVPALVQVVEKDNEMQVRVAAIRALGQIGPDAVPSLIGALASTATDVRQAAAFALGSIREAKLSVPALVQVVEKDNEMQVRVAAIRALGQIGSLSRDAVPTLTRTMEQQPPPTGHAAAIALAEIGEAETAIPGLLAAIQDRYAESRKEAVQALGRLGRKAEPAILDLVKIFGEVDDATQYTVAGALAEIGPTAVIILVADTATKGNLKSADDKLTAWAERAELSTLSELTVELLNTAISVDSEQTRDIALLSVWALGPRAVVIAVVACSESYSGQTDLKVRSIIFGLLVRSVCVAIALCEERDGYSAEKYKYRDALIGALEQMSLSRDAVLKEVGRSALCRIHLGY